MSQSVVGNLFVNISANLSDLTSGLADAVRNSKRAADEMVANMNTAQSSFNTRGFTSFAQGFARALDDVQYGFRGIVNNMEQLGTAAATAFGASTSAAMGFGAALTIVAIGINSLLDDIERLADPRTAFEKLATSAAGFSSSVIKTRAELRLMKAELDALEATDKASGFMPFIQRQMGALANFSDRNSVRATDLLLPRVGLVQSAQGASDQKLLDAVNSGMIKLGDAATKQLRERVAAQEGTTPTGAILRALGGTTFEEQVKANQAVGKDAARLQNDLLMRAEDARRQESAYRAGIGLIAGDTNPRNQTDEAYQKAFGFASQGNIAEMRTQLFAQFGKEGLKETEATQKAIELLGDASMGELARRLPQYKLAEKADDVLTAEQQVNKSAFERQEQQKQEQEQRRAEMEARMKAAEDNRRRAREFEDMQDAELRRIAENDRMSERRQGLQKRAEAIETNMKRSEIVGTADAFVRNLNAGIGEDPQIKELKEIKEEIKKLKPIGALG